MCEFRGGLFPQLFAGAVLLFGAFGSSDVAASVPSTGGEAGPSAYFDLSETPSSGTVAPGQTLRLSVRLTAVHPPENQTLVAILEGHPFIRRLVPLQQDPKDHAFHATFALEPIDPEVASGKTKALRVRVTFARMQGMALEEFLVRAVYLTIGLTMEDTTLSTAPPSSTPHVLSDGFSEEQGLGAAALKHRSAQRFTEQNIIPSPVSARAQVYWRGVSERIGERWRMPVVSAASSPPSGPVVAVRFRLHANGEAQLIQIERSSGVAEIDEAGLQAVVRAHPFPPFPADLAEEAVDMHVEFGSRSSPSPSAVRQNSSLDGH